MTYWTAILIYYVGLISFFLGVLVTLVVQHFFPEARR